MYKGVNRYTVFYKDGGHGQSTMPADEKVEEGKLATRPADPTEDGWKFKSWHLNNDYKDNPFDFDTPIIENITLYAKWKSLSIEQGFEKDYDTALLGNDYELYTLGMQGFSFDMGFLPRSPVR